MKKFLLIPFILIHLVSSGQTDSEKLKKVKTISQANAFIKANQDLGGEVIELNSGTDSSETAKKIFAEKSGGLISIDGYTYKVIEIRKSFLLRVSYLNLLGDSLSMTKIDSLRKVIISAYTDGIPFAELAKKYTMDGNPNCDLGWVPQEMLLKEFSSAVKKHKKGDLFTINIPDKKWYYVTLKTFDEREVQLYSVLKIKNTN